MSHVDAIFAGGFAIVGAVVTQLLVEWRANRRRDHERAVARLDRTYEQRRDACMAFLSAVDDAWRAARLRWHEGERPLPAHEITAPVYAAQAPLDVYNSVEVADAGRALASKLFRLCDGYGGDDDPSRLNDYHDDRETFVNAVRRDLGAGGETSP